ncbi:MAG TPA: CRTAC1 family protein [Verrucomicrobiota bacterium]|nr:CRTAC1 family protein [Verrucomicrobiota bacterium]
MIHFRIHAECRLAPLFALVAWLPLASTISTAASTSSPPKSGTAQMAELLARLAKQTTPQQNQFLTLEQIRLLQEQLATNTVPANAVPLEYYLGTQLLQAGKNEEALAAFGRLSRLTQKLGIRQSATNDINIEINRALAHLRMGELRNCLTNHTSQSCLLPIEGHGIHKWQEGSRAAIGILTNLLQKYPDNLSARWLLNVSAMTVGDYPDRVPARWLIPPKTFASDYDIGRFPEIAGPAGLAINQLSGGSAVEDFDGDGLLDVMVTSIGLSDQMTLFHNNGDGTFSDRTKEAGLTGLTGGLNLVTTDYNNDGYPDVLVVRGAWAREGGRFPDSLLRNNGDGTFEDVTAAAGMLSFHPSQTAVWFDFDGDGWLDVFIGNETAQNEPRHSCELYRNNRDGTFTEMALGAGLRINSYVKGVTTGDFNNDGRPDLYVSILGKPNQLFRNDGPAPASSGTNTWTFTEVGAAAGVQKPIWSFPTWFFDYDNDGFEDLYVGSYFIRDVGDIAADYLGLPNNGEHAKLYHNRGNGTFEDVSKAANLDHVLHGMGANFGDLDNDGWLDFYLGTGNPDLTTTIPNRMFRNADGKSFQDVTTSGGFGHLQKGHGVSFADIDNDGDQDVHIDMGGAYSGDITPNALFANPGHGNHWVKLQLVGVKANRPGIGARLKLTLSGPTGERVIHHTVNTGGSFGSNPLRQEIGLGDAKAIKSLEVLWPGSGTRQVFTNLEPDRSYRLKEDAKVAEVVPLKTFALPLPDAPALIRKP